MSDDSKSANFDHRSPAFLNNYDRIVSGVNVGYDLVFTLTAAMLRNLRNPELRILVVGAGGGKEIRTLLPGQPGWILTGVDPSRAMLDIAEQHALHLGVAHQTCLVHGQVSDVTDALFDAATCMFVLQFLPDDGEKLRLLREIAKHLKPDAPLLLVDGLWDANDADEVFGAWHEYGVLMGMPVDQMREILTQLRASQTVVSEEREQALLREAGFRKIRRFFAGLTIHGFAARAEPISR